jgi:dihydrofolate reductase
MGRIIVIEYVTLDGVVEDPDGRSGTGFGGWAFRFGGRSIGGDKFRLGAILDTGALLFGRRTWEHFSRLWPARTDPVSTAMNTMPKYVRTRGNPDLAVWTNSHRLPVPDDLAASVTQLASRHDLVVIGSIGLVRELAEAGLVHEYRLLTVPTFVGQGTRLFTDTIELDLVEVEADGPMALQTLRPTSVATPG